MGKVAASISGMIAILLTTGCGPVNQPTRPMAAQMEDVRRLAVVVDLAGDFTVIKERTVVGAAHAGAGGAAQLPVVGVVFLAEAIVSAFTAHKEDSKHAAKVAPHLADVAPKQTLLEALLGTLRSGDRFGATEILERPPEGSARSQFDGVLLVKLRAWGLVAVAKNPDLLSAFVDFEVRMLRTSAPDAIWEESNAMIGQGRHPLEAYLMDPALARQEITEAFETTGQRLAYELLYPRGVKR